MATVAPTDSLPARRAADEAVGAAIDLGWRVAALYGLRASRLRPLPVDDLLLNRRSLGAEDRLELELRAIAGVAQRAGVPLAQDELAVLLRLVSPAATSPDGEEDFRDALERTHVELAKGLWAKDEGHGRAYELGNFVSDTWNRILRPRATPSAHEELREIFATSRVQRMKALLDDLQSRLDPAAVHVVTSHLDAWHARVAAQPADAGDPELTPEAAAERYEPVERQVMIWRQILTGDKEPEAYIGSARRAEVRDELSRQLWRAYQRYWWVILLVAVIGGLVGYLVARQSSLAGSVIGTLTAVAATLGVTRASIVASLRRGLQQWGELMWNRSLAVVVCRETLVVDELLPPPAQH